MFLLPQGLGKSLRGIRAAWLNAQVMTWGCGLSWDTRHCPRSSCSLYSGHQTFVVDDSFPFNRPPPSTTSRRCRIAARCLHNQVPISSWLCVFYSLLLYHNYSKPLRLCNAISSPSITLQKFTNQWRAELIRASLTEKGTKKDSPEHPLSKTQAFVPIDYSSWSTRQEPRRHSLLQLWKLPPAQAGTRGFTWQPQQQQPRRLTGSPTGEGLAACCLRSAQQWWGFTTCNF